MLKECLIQLPITRRNIIQVALLEKSLALSVDLLIDSLLFHPFKFISTYYHRRLKLSVASYDYTKTVSSFSYELSSFLIISNRLKILLHYL